MENVRDFENVNNATENNDEPIRVTVEEKEGFWKKVGNGLSKFAHSTPGKIIGGVSLVAVGVVGTLLCGALRTDGDETDENVVADVDYSELVDVSDDDQETVVTEF